MEIGLGVSIHVITSKFSEILSRPSFYDARSTRHQDYSQNILFFLHERVFTMGAPDIIYEFYNYHVGARGSAVGWGTALQAGRSWVRFPIMSLEFFIDIILPGRTMPPGVDLASNRNEYQEYFLVIKSAGGWGWQPYHLHVPIVLKSGSLNLLEPSGPVQACNGIALLFYKYHNYLLDFFTLGTII